MLLVWGCPDQFGWGDAPDSSTPKRRSNGRQRRRKSSVWLGVVHLGMTPTLFGVASLLIAASLVPLRGLRR